MFNQILIVLFISPTCRPSTNRLGFFPAPPTYGFARTYRVLTAFFLSFSPCSHTLVFISQQYPGRDFCMTVLGFTTPPCCSFLPWIPPSFSPRPAPSLTATPVREAPPTSASDSLPAPALPPLRGLQTSTVLISFDGDPLSKPYPHRTLYRGTLKLVHTMNPLQFMDHSTSLTSPSLNSAKAPPEQLFTTYLCNSFAPSSQIRVV